MISSVVVFKWSKPGYRTTYTAEHVNTAYSMVRRHYSKPVRFICITDDATGISPDVEVFPLWDHFRELKNPTWSWGPACYPRLYTYSKEFKHIAGERFVCMDLDVAAAASLDPLWDRDEDFVIYASTTARGHYNGSMWMMTAGCRSQVWEDFDPETSPKLANAAGNRGSDQGWIQYRLGKGEATWTVKDGVYGYRTDLRLKNRQCPADARLIIFHGEPKPWSPRAHRASPWIREHYR
jgi:hypothetical protein